MVFNQMTSHMTLFKPQTGFPKTNVLNQSQRNNKRDRMLNAHLKNKYTFLNMLRIGAVRTTVASLIRNNFENISVKNSGPCNKVQASHEIRTIPDISYDVRRITERMQLFTVCFTFYLFGGTSGDH